jgi:hypothetical protein
MFTITSLWKIVSHNVQMRSVQITNDRGETTTQELPISYMHYVSVAISKALSNPTPNIFDLQSFVQHIITRDELIDLELNALSIIDQLDKSSSQPSFPETKLYQILEDIKSLKISLRQICTDKTLATKLQHGIIEAVELYNYSAEIMSYRLEGTTLHISELLITPYLNFQQSIKLLSDYCSSLLDADNHTIEFRLHAALYILGHIINEPSLIKHIPIANPTHFLIELLEKHPKIIDEYMPLLHKTLSELINIASNISSTKTVCTILNICHIISFADDISRLDLIEKYLPQILSIPIHTPSTKDNYNLLLLGWIQKELPGHFKHFISIFPDDTLSTVAKHIIYSQNGIQCLIAIAQSKPHIVVEILPQALDILEETLKYHSYQEKSICATYNAIIFISSFGVINTIADKVINVLMKPMHNPLSKPLFIRSIQNMYHDLKDTKNLETFIAGLPHNILLPLLTAQCPTKPEISLIEYIIDLIKGPNILELIVRCCSIDTLIAIANMSFWSQNSWSEEEAPSTIEKLPIYEYSDVNNTQFSAIILSRLMATNQLDQLHRPIDYCANVFPCDFNLAILCAISLNQLNDLMEEFAPNPEFSLSAISIASYIFGKYADSARIIDLLKSIIGAQKVEQLEIYYSDNEHISEESGIDMSMSTPSKHINSAQTTSLGENSTSTICLEDYD